MKKMIFAAAVSAVAAMTIVITPGTASAEPWPTSCKSGIGYGARYAWARCTGGAGYVRAFATCSNGSAKTKVTGPWKWVVGGDPVNNVSNAYCPSTHKTAVGHSYDIKQ